MQKLENLYTPIVFVLLIDNNILKGYGLNYEI
jgi:hypothetical protein